MSETTDSTSHDTISALEELDSVIEEARKLIAASEAVKALIEARSADRWQGLELAAYRRALRACGKAQKHLSLSFQLSGSKPKL